MNRSVHARSWINVVIHHSHSLLRQWLGQRWERWEKSISMTASAGRYLYSVLSDHKRGDFFIFKYHLRLRSILRMSTWRQDVDLTWMQAKKIIPFPFSTSDIFLVFALWYNKFWAALPLKGNKMRLNSQCLVLQLEGLVIGTCHRVCHHMCAESRTSKHWF